MPRVIIYAFLLTSMIYFLISIVLIASVDMSTLAKKSAPFAEILYERTLLGSKLISIVSIIATVNGGLIQIILSSRIFYGMGQKNLGVKFFSIINPITHTPVYATLLTIFLVLIFSYFFSIEQLARITSIAVLFVFCLVNLSLIILIRKKIIPHKKVVCLLMPFSAFVICLILLITQLYIELNKIVSYKIISIYSPVIAIIV